MSLEHVSFILQPWQDPPSTTPKNIFSGRQPTYRCAAFIEPKTIVNTNIKISAPIAPDTYDTPSNFKLWRVGPARVEE